MMRCIVWSVFLFLGHARSLTYPELCFPVYYDRENSGSQPDIRIPYPGHYIMFQEFCINNSTTNLTTNFTQNASWSHPRNNLSDPSRYYINNPLSPYRKDGQQCVNSSITLLNVTELDHGVYTVVVSTNCGSQNYTNFTLDISPCGVDARPFSPTQEPVTISDVKKPPSLSFQFQGDSRKSDYIFHLTKSGETLNCVLCISEESDCENLHIKCYRDIPQCNTTLSVCFYNFTNQDVGEYCVAPSLLGSGSIGNMSCVELDIQPSDQDLTVILAVSTGVGVVLVITTIGCIMHVIVAAVCKKRRNQECGDNERLLPDVADAAAADDTERDSPNTPRDCEALWQQLPNTVTVLNISQLQKIARQLNKWELLARALGLEEPDITEIQENNPRNYKEQRYQMLHKWYQGEKQASLKNLIRCVEVELGDRELAQKIVTALK